MIITSMLDGDQISIISKQIFGIRRKKLVKTLQSNNLVTRELFKQKIPVQNSKFI